MTEEYVVGIGKTDITGPVAGVTFMGYARFEQHGTGLADRLHCRAFFISSEANKKDNVLLVHTDLMGVSVRLRQRVASRVEKEFPDLLKTHRMIIHSQHTHSGPGGYLPSYLYYITTFGFVEEHFKLLEERIVAAIRMAVDESGWFRAKIFLSQTKLPSVGRNRSPEAFVQNPEWERKEYEEKYGEQKNSIMTVLRFFDVQQKLNRGLLSFFPVHTVSFTRDNTLVSADNKGFAEFIVETSSKHSTTTSPDLIAAFFQTEAGDVSPNMKDAADSILGDPVFEGDGEDYIDACERIGRSQATTAMKVLSNGDKAGANEMQIKGTLEGRLIYANYSDFSFIDENSNKPIKSCPGMAGLSMFGGTEDGRGVFCVTEGWTNKTVSESVWQDKCWKMVRYTTTMTAKLPFAGNSQAFDFNFASSLTKEKLDLWMKRYKFFSSDLWNFFPEFPQDYIECQYPKVSGVVSGLGDNALIPMVLPAQIIRIGQLILPGLPFEITSMSGHRIRKALLRELQDTDAVVEVLGISNGYVQYMATEEEYSAQHYEGSSTQFGPNQLNTSIHLLKQLTRASLNNDPVFGVDSEESEFRKGATVKDAFEEFDGGDKTLVFDEVMHHTISWMELSPPPYLISYYPAGSLKKDVNLGVDNNGNREIDLLSTKKEDLKKLSADFYCVFPANSQSIIPSFCDVEKLSANGSFENFLKDEDWNVRFIYRRNKGFVHVCTCEWLAHNSVEFHEISETEYRFRINGAYEDSSGEPIFYTGTSSSFKVINGNKGTEGIPRITGDVAVKEYLLRASDEVLLLGALFAYFAVRGVLSCFCFKSKSGKGEKSE